MTTSEEGLAAPDVELADGLIPRTARSPARAAVLSFVWPGLGHAYLHRRVRAFWFAIPPAVVLLAGLAMVARDPGAFAINMLAPAFGLLVLGMITFQAVWRVAAIFDTWWITRDRDRALADPTLPLAVSLIVFVFAVYLALGAFVYAFGDAGSRIFTSDRPHGSSQIDDILGGPSPRPSGDVLGVEDTNGDGVMDGDINRDGVVDSRDDLNGDGVINADDVDVGDINGDGIIDGNDVVDPEGTPPGEDPDTSPGPSFDPSVTPPPIDPGEPGPGDDPPPFVPGDGPINVLFVGLDSGFDRNHSLSDTLILASYFPERGTVTMISIPRDTGRLPLYTGGVYPNRVNSFLGYAGRHPELFPEGPIAALMRELGYLYGIPIHYYAATNLEGLPRAVDAVGGVDVNVTKAVDSEKLNYHLAIGTYHFNGAEALVYCRIRYGSSDFARARRQQQVIKALTARVSDPSVAVRLPEVINALTEVVRTNVPRDQVPTLLRILDVANDASTENIVLSPNGYARRIPAAEVNGRYMIELNLAAVRELSMRVFGPYSRYT